MSQELIAALNNLKRLDLEHAAFGSSMHADLYGEFVRFDDLVKILAEAGIKHDEYTKYDDDGSVIRARGFYA